MLSMGAEKNAYREENRRRMEVKSTKHDIFGTMRYTNERQLKLSNPAKSNLSNERAIFHVSYSLLYCVRHLR